MSKKLHGISVGLPIFNSSFNVFWGSVEELNKFHQNDNNNLIKNYNKEEELSEKLLQGNPHCYVDENDCPVYIYIGKKHNNYNTIVHEVTHYVMSLFHHHELPIKPESTEGQETMCYTMGYICGEIMKLKKKDWATWDSETNNWE